MKIMRFETFAVNKSPFKNRKSERRKTAREKGLGQSTTEKKHHHWQIQTSNKQLMVWRYGIFIIDSA